MAEALLYLKVATADQTRASSIDWDWVHYLTAILIELELPRAGKHGDKWGN
jgi:hypothetical protein